MILADIKISIDRITKRSLAKNCETFHKIQKIKQFVGEHGSSRNNNNCSNFIQWKSYRIVQN